MDMTRDDLEQLIDGQAAKACEGVEARIKDHIEGVFTEYKEDTLKQIGDIKDIHKGSEYDGMSGYKNLNEFFVDVIKAGDDINSVPRLKEWNEKVANAQKAAGSPTQSAGSLAAGGALLPTEFLPEVRQRGRARQSIKSRCMVIPMNTLAIDMPDLADYDQSQGVTSGTLKFRTVEEQGTANPDDIALGQISLNLKEYNALVYVSRRLTTFSPISVQGLIMSQIGDAEDLALTNHFLNGSGSGVPLGAINSGNGALVQVAKETNQTADTIVYENVLEAKVRNWQGGGEWWANRDVEKQLGLMNLSVGTGGAPVFLPNGTAESDVPQRLLNRPLNYTDENPIVGDMGDIAIIDWGQYFVGEFAGQPGISTDSSIHFKFDTRQEALQFTFYADGQPAWKLPRTPLKGNTSSPFVAIAARA